MTINVIVAVSDKEKEKILALKKRRGQQKATQMNTTQHFRYGRIVVNLI